ncbi:hypothetical protein RJT34_00117 [Clitoria ternatea]|uniref:Protein kinase domain-containing protein n=1 Tax=Clitoria ternatea TaxID=43366 RepID=A0AAN9PZW1_CLITE
MNETQVTTLVQGTFGYLDPEYFQSSKLTDKSDVYSFGVVLTELLTSMKAISFIRPESNRNLSMYFVSSLRDGNLPQILDKNLVSSDANVDQIMKVAYLAKRCLMLKGEERPNMKEVAMELERIKILTKLPSEDTILPLDEIASSFKIANPHCVVDNGSCSITTGSCSITTGVESTQSHTFEGR